MKLPGVKSDSYCANTYTNPRSRMNRGGSRGGEMRGMDPPPPAHGVFFLAVKYRQSLVLYLTQLSQNFSTVLLQSA